MLADTFGSSMCRVPQSPVHISADEVSAQSTPSADGAVRSRSFILSKYVLASADNLICTQYQVFHNSYKLALSVILCYFSNLNSLQTVHLPSDLYGQVWTC